MTTNTTRKTYSATELAEVARLHKLWRAGDASGARADLADANLAGADLAGADLAGAYLAGAYLAGAYLAGADLARADLAGANLAGADLAGAYLADAYLAGADLAGANLADANLAGAYLAGAYLADADLAGAYLAGARNIDQDTPRTDPPEPYKRATTDEEREQRRLAHMQRYRERHPEVPIVENLDAKILAALCIQGNVLDMSDWHTCATTHCRAGWAIHLAGKAGYELEKLTTPQEAGAMIYRASTGRVPHFFASTDRAMEDIKACAAAQQQTEK